MLDPRTLKLGKRPARHDPRTLRLGKYLRPATVAASPGHLHLETKVAQWPIYGNDRYGDCVFADIGHQIEAWTADANTEQSVTDADVLGAYSAVTGFNPNDPNSDRGTVWLDALNYWRKTGVGGHRIAGYVSVTVDKAHARTATWLFGGLQLGIDLPITAKAQIGKVWTVGRGSDGWPGSWGGHATPVLGYDASHLFVITWGAVQRMTWGFFNRYVDESYAALSTEWISQVTQRSPEGFDLATLQADLASIG